MPARRSHLWVGFSFALSACAGSNSTNIPKQVLPQATASPAPAKSALGHVTIRMSIPATIGSSARRRRNFIGAATAGLLITGAPYNPTIVPAAFDLSGSSSLCTATAAGRSCTVSFTLPQGTFDLVFTTYAVSPVNGGFADQKQLATGTVSNVTIGANGATNLAVALGGTIATMTISPAKMSLDGENAGSFSLALGLLDAAGETIIAGTETATNGSDLLSNPYALAITEGKQSCISFHSSSGLLTTLTGATAAASNVFAVFYDPNSNSGVPLSATPRVVGCSGTIAASADGATGATASLNPLFVTPDTATGSGTFTSYVTGSTDMPELNFSALSQSETIAPAGGIAAPTFQLDPGCPATTFAITSGSTGSTIVPEGTGSCTIAVSDGATTIALQASSLPADGSQHYIYVSDALLHTIAIFPASVTGAYTAAPIGIVPQPANVMCCYPIPQGALAIDSQYHLYAQENGTVDRYTAMAAYPTNPIGVHEPSNFAGSYETASVGLDAQSFIYVPFQSAGGAEIDVYPTSPQSAPKVASFTIPYLPRAVAVDASGKVYVAAPNGKIDVYPAIASSSSIPLATISSSQSGAAFDGMTFDASGRLYVIDSGNEQIAIFPALGSSTGAVTQMPVTIPVDAGLGYSVAVDQAGRIAVTDAASVKIYAAIPAAATGAQSLTPVATIAGGMTGISQAGAVAIR